MSIAQFVSAISILKNPKRSQDGHVTLRNAMHFFMFEFQSFHKLSHGVCSSLVLPGFRREVSLVLVSCVFVWEKRAAKLRIVVLQNRNRAVKILVNRKNFPQQILHLQDQCMRARKESAPHDYGRVNDNM